jgi:hypothetical protein
LKNVVIQHRVLLVVVPRKPGGDMRGRIEDMSRQESSSQYRTKSCRRFRARTSGDGEEDKVVLWAVRPIDDGMGSWDLIVVK